MSDIHWQLPWEPVPSGAEILRLQQELEKEVGPKHPLWGRHPQVIGRRVDCDDILVRLPDGALARVHLVWHGRIDRFPDKFPGTTFFASVAEFHEWMERDAGDYGDA